MCVCNHLGPIVLTFFHADFGKEFPGPKFVGRSILKLPLSKLCAVPFALNRAFLVVLKQGEEQEWPAKGQKEKKGHVKTGQVTSQSDGVSQR